MVKDILFQIKYSFSQLHPNRRKEEKKEQKCKKLSKHTKTKRRSALVCTRLTSEVSVSGYITGSSPNDDIFVINRMSNINFFI